MGPEIPDDLAALVIDALTSSICVVDLEGNILGVNRAWIELGAQNAAAGRTPDSAANYFDVSKRFFFEPSSTQSQDFYNELRSVLAGNSRSFDIEYESHTPTELRWFLARVTPLSTRLGVGGDTRAGAVVSHMNITDRKLLELNYARLASTDPLTNLSNRRFFDEYSRIEFSRSRQFCRDISVLIMDLDNFKHINDRFGHLAGDEVLKKVSARCKALLREGDLFARMGGEEFVALLTDADATCAMLLAERLRSGVAAMTINTSAGLIRVTTSIGVTTVEAADRSIGSALHRADEALYAAKHMGKNRVVAAA